MPQEPKKRHSRQRQGKRRASIKYVFKDQSHRLKKSRLDENKVVEENRQTNENSK